MNSSEKLQNNFATEAEGAEICWCRAQLPPWAALVGVEGRGEHAHAEGLGQDAHAAAHGAEADQAQGAALELGEGPARPLARAHVAVPWRGCGGSRPA
jgi:hypothetical protein